MYNLNLRVVHKIRSIRLITLLTIKMYTESAINTGTVSLVGELKGLNTGLHWVGPQYGHSQCFQFEYNRKRSALIIRIRSVRRLYYSNWKYWIWPKVLGWPWIPWLVNIPTFNFMYTNVNYFNGIHIITSLLCPTNCKCEQKYNLRWISYLFGFKLQIILIFPLAI